MQFAFYHVDYSYFTNLELICERSSSGNFCFFICLRIRHVIRGCEMTSEQATHRTPELFLLKPGDYGQYAAHYSLGIVGVLQDVTEHHQSRCCDQDVYQVQPHSTEERKIHCQHLTRRCFQTDDSALISFAFLCCGSLTDV